MTLFLGTVFTYCVRGSANRMAQGLEWFKKKKTGKQYLLGNPAPPPKKKRMKCCFVGTLTRSSSWYSRKKCHTHLLLFPVYQIPVIGNYCSSSLPKFQENSCYSKEMGEKIILHCEKKICSLSHTTSLRNTIKIL